MGKCPQCSSTVVEVDSTQGQSYCRSCGIVLEENTIVSEITFGETSGGAAVVQGSLVGADATRARMSGPYGNRDSQESKEKTVAAGKRRIKQIAQALRLSERLSESAGRWFNLAVASNFVKGRKESYVVAACMYITCRMEKTHHMLIDFSDILQVNVFVLGSTYLKLVKVLNVTLPVMDPSLFISRFAALLEFKEETQKVATDAVRLVQRFKRDWMDTGRRPAGICGACLLLAARMNNFRRSMQEIVQVVKIADSTLRRRLDEFKLTASGDMTIQDFRTIWLDEEANPPAFMAKAPGAAGSAGKKNARGKPKSKSKLAIEQTAVNDIIKQADAQEDGDDDEDAGPSSRAIGTASTLSEGKGKERAVDSPNSSAVFQAAADLDSEIGTQDDEGDDSPEDFSAALDAIDPTLLDESPASSSAAVGPSSRLMPDGAADLSEPASPSSVIASGKNVLEEADEVVDAAVEHEVGSFLNEGQGAELNDELNEADRREAERRALDLSSKELEGLDEDELDSFIMTPEEVKVKTRLWMEFNKDYLETLARKQAKAQGDPGAEEKKKRKRKSATGPAARATSAADSARNLVKQKKFSKKINYAAFDTLFDTADIPQRMTERQLRGSTAPLTDDEIDDGKSDAGKSDAGKSEGKSDGGEKFDDDDDDNDDNNNDDDEREAVDETDEPDVDGVAHKKTRLTSTADLDLDDDDDDEMDEGHDGGDEFSQLRGMTAGDDDDDGFEEV